MKRATLGIGVAASICLLSLSGIAFAESSPQSIMIGPGGTGAISGTVSSITGSTLSISSWGGQWQVDASTASIAVPTGNGTIASIKQGDAVVVKGTFSPASLSLIAKEVRDGIASSSTRTFTTSLGAPIGGTVSSLNFNAGTFSVTSPNKGSYVVTATSGTKILVNGQSATLAGITDGMFVMVRGTVDANTKTIGASAIIAGAGRGHPNALIGRKAHGLFGKRHATSTPQQ